MRLCFVEDMAVVGLEPLTLTRPAYGLRLGAVTLGDRVARAFGVGPGPARRAAIVRSVLEPIVRERDPHTVLNDGDWLAQGPVIVANSRWVPPKDFEPSTTAAPWLGLCNGRPACAVAGPERAVALTSHRIDEWFDDLLAKVDGEEVGGHWVDRPWDLVSLNEQAIRDDFEALGGDSVTNRHLQSMALVGSPDQLRIHETARIDPYTVFDATNGPIIVGRDVWVQPFTRIEGPCVIGPGTQLFRANIRGAVTIGPACRVGGEVEASIVQGYSNKYHEGFLGHSYVGEWVNLGAITSNSDLRNDYGEVEVPLRGDPVPTGQAKVGCFIGDHSRTGLGSMLNTGTSIGVMCNVLPAGWLLPKHVPSFSSVLWGKVARGFDLEQMFETARIVKGRRGLEFTEAEEGFYRSLFEQTRLERQRAFQKAQGSPPIETGRPVSAAAR
ncbi:putative sugar nucleotidyl transferase [Tautonia sp. JC769]|uniref:putative sugar nucleotidyl transferase n=1 Tax=Tautonia sp. JC769 TaxID=3232135 RepID=UPI00345886AF